MVVPLLGIMGGSTDYMRVAMIRAALQNSLDIATIAAAKDNSSSYSQVATKLFDANAAQQPLRVTSRTFVKNADTSYTGTASTTVTTLFSPLIGITSYDLTVTSTAMPASSSTIPCLMVLDASAQGFLANSGASIAASSCEFDVKSKANPAAIFNSNTVITTAKFCIEGSSIIDNGGTHPNLSKGCTTPADPFAGKLPTPASSTCTYSNLNYSNSNVSLLPGVYCGWFNFNNSPKVTFSPGVYVIKGGGWNVNGGDWIGTGVTFFFADSSAIQFNSGISAHLTAPTSGTYQGLLFYEIAGSTKSAFIFNDSRDNQLEGIMYLPNRNVTYNSGSNCDGDKLTMVFNTLIVNQTDWRLAPYTTTITGSSSNTSAYLMR